MATRVLIVDDSRTARAALRAAFDTDPEFRVVAEASTAVEALEAASALRPDLVTMDVNLPGSSGIEATEAIMSSHPTRVVIVTAANLEDPDLIYRCLQVGALEVWPKPPGPTHPTYARDIARSLRALKALARVPVVRHSKRARASARPVVSEPESPPLVPPILKMCEAILIGASTGGPPVIAAILEGIPPGFPVPIVIVQHITPGFVKGFVSWLHDSTRHAVEVVDAARPLRSGTVYVAGDDSHTVILSRNELGLSFKEPRNFQRPSVDVLFESAAAQLGPRCIAVLLTGMGSDGARGLLALKNAGAFTLVQSPATCVVEGMPGAAIKLGAATRVLSPEEISRIVPQRVRAAERENGDEGGKE